MGKQTQVTLGLRTEDQSFTSGLKNAGKKVSSFSRGLKSLKRELGVFISVGAAIRFMSDSIKATADGAAILKDIRDDFTEIKKVVGEELNPTLWGLKEALDSLTDAWSKPMNEKSFLGKLWSNTLDMMPIIGQIRQLNRETKEAYENYVKITGGPKAGKLTEIKYKSVDEKSLLSDLKDERFDFWKEMAGKESAWGDQFEFADKFFTGLEEKSKEFGEFYADVAEDLDVDFFEAIEDNLDELAEKDWEVSQRLVNNWEKAELAMLEIQKNIKINFREILVNGIGDLVEDLFEKIGQGMMSFQELGKSIAQFFASILSQLGSMLLTAGTIAMFIPGFQGVGASMIAGGVALKAAAGIAKGLSNRTTNETSSYTRTPLGLKQDVNTEFVVHGYISNNVIKLANGRASGNTTAHGIRY
jgi:hypothetical protein